MYVNHLKLVHQGRPRTNSCLANEILKVRDIIGRWEAVLTDPRRSLIGDAQRIDALEVNQGKLLALIEVATARGILDEDGQLLPIFTARS